MTGVHFALFAALLAAVPAHAKRHVRPEDDRHRGGSDRAFAHARVSFRSPQDRAAVAPGDLRVELAVSGYALGGAVPGGAAPHAHLLVDDLPALQIDDAREPLLLRGLPPGPHVLRLVLCRPWHEVVKARGAFALVRIQVGDAPPPRGYVSPDPRKPLLTYVLPIGVAPPGAPRLELARAPGAAAAPAPDGGEPDGGAEPAGAGAPDGGAAADPAPDAPILDFFLSGAKLGRRGAKVRVVLDRRELPLVTDWKPVRLRRARGGPHRLTVDLLDRRGLRVGNGVNRTDRAFAAPE